MPSVRVQLADGTAFQVDEVDYWATDMENNLMLVGVVDGEKINRAWVAHGHWQTVVWVIEDRISDEAISGEVEAT